MIASKFESKLTRRVDVASNRNLQMNPVSGFDVDFPMLKESGYRKPCRVTLPECCTAGVARVVVRFSSDSMSVSQYFSACSHRVMLKSRNHAEKRNDKPAMYCCTDTDMKVMSGLERPEQACTFMLHRFAEN